jgi:tyrosine-protein kinase Etk/Wzc
MGLPLFATINYSATADTSGRRRGKPDIIAISDPTDLSVEAFRSMRTSLHFGMLDAKNKALSITSSHPGAGKSYSSVNFAVIAAQSGQRVCLIDADMRRGYLRRYFGVGPSKGLADILAGDASLEDCLYQGPIPDLMFIPTGKYPPNPSELLMRAEFGELIKTLDEHFDLIVLDCPPILAVTDPVIIAREVGTTILIARHDLTAPGEIEASIKSFEAAGQKLAGAILNGFDPKKAKAGYGYGYSYGYRYSYEKRDEKDH